jgi:uncharacterized coiled-coil DUF342 family protein
MTEEVKQERDPMLDKVVTLKFTVEQINIILNLIAAEIPYNKSVGLINEIQAQCGPQIAEAANEQ